MGDDDFRPGRLVGLSLPDLTVHLTRVGADRAVPAPAETLDALVREAVKRLVRTGGRGDLREGAVSLSTLAEDRSPAGGGAPSETTLGPRWDVLADLLGDLADALDDDAVPMLLRSHHGKSRQVLEATSAGGWIPRRDVRDRVEVSDSHLSHILRELVDAGLVHRRRRGREVEIRLTTAGRDAIGVEPAPDPAPPSLATVRRLAAGVDPARSAELIRRAETGRNTPNWDAA